MSATTASTRGDRGRRRAQRVVAWLEAKLDSEVTAVRRQPRVAPVWFADVGARAPGGEVRRRVRARRPPRRRAVMPLEHEHLSRSCWRSAGSPSPT